ncbi:SWIM zinc finger family protein [Hymenobacter convexus]|uniref:SWIM zinc finger family protein n=1 Tax=Hymenobacter sp. CA1UV-4 TaxID=3063782 RepID=UPI002712F26F|nr:DUF5691 domain-containing protein [Hymenobacter sp. CA1UV-4]MDO7852089.1 DUF5691 domain-containing protein [Hymenobacter sp. CA1UV-4]
MITYSEAQALALITDPGTLKRGQELLKPAKWASLGRTDTAAWGECAGSGAKPYLTGIDLAEPAFKCNCPSRVFPCKHGAGLLLLLARQPELFSGNTPPAWLGEWLEKRQQTQEKKAENPVAKASKAAVAAEMLADEASPGSPFFGEGTAAGEAVETPLQIQATPAVDPKRLARMAAGAEELTAWLEDLMRAGLASLDKQPTSFWESQAARLVDNQLPGLAATVRELATLRHAHADWPARLLGRLGELYLLTRTFQNLPNLAPDARADVLQQVGINLKKEDLLVTAAPVADAWRVLGQYRWEEDRLTARRTWLHGRDTGRTALVLEFSFGGQPFSTPFMPHGAYLGELAFYPGLLPLRAAPVSMKFDGTVPAHVVPAGRSISELLADYAQALARQPWLREWPATLTQVLTTPAADGRWLLHHAAEAGTLPLRFADENIPWQLLAENGGQPMTLFGEWDGQAFRPLSSWVETAGASATAGAQRAPAFVAHLPPLSTGSILPTDSISSAEIGPPSEVTWPRLLRLALLGTRQSSEAMPAFPTKAASAELQLLLAAGTLALMRKAGYRPPAATTVPAPPAPPETWEPLGPMGAALLDQFLAGHQRYYYRHFARLQEARRRVPHRQLVALLNFAKTKGYERFLAEYAAVLGTHGQWLLAQNPEWQKIAEAAAETTDAVWEHGTPLARRLFLEQLFETDPARAIGLLAEALPQEPAATQIKLLASIHGNFGQRYPLHPALGPVLEPLLKSRTRDVRQLGAKLLVQTTDNALLPRLQARAEALLDVKASPTGPGRLAVTLPDKWGADWQRDGIEQHTADYPGGERAGWLGQVLALIPPRHWVEQWQVSPSQAVAMAAASDWPTVLLPAWLRAAYLHEDAAFARALLDHEAHSPVHAADLIVAAGRIMPEAEKQAWLLSLLPDDGTLPKPPNWVDWLFIPDLYDYPLPLLRRVLPLLRTLLSQPWQHLHMAQEQTALQLLDILSEDVDEMLLPLFEVELSPIMEAQPRHAQRIAAVFAALHNRQQLTASLTEPAN